jgi:hypothetical protein
MAISPSARCRGTTRESHKIRAIEDHAARGGDHPLAKALRLGGWSLALQPFVPVGLPQAHRWPHAAETADPGYSPSLPAPQRLPSATILRSPLATQRIVSPVSLDAPYLCAWRMMLSLVSLIRSCTGRVVESESKKYADLSRWAGSNRCAEHCIATKVTTSIDLALSSLMSGRSIYQAL